MQRICKKKKIKLLIDNYYHTMWIKKGDPLIFQIKVDFSTFCTTNKGIIMMLYHDSIMMVVRNGHLPQRLWLTSLSASLSTSYLKWDANFINNNLTDNIWQRITDQFSKLGNSRSLFTDEAQNFKRAWTLPPRSWNMSRTGFSWLCLLLFLLQNCVMAEVKRFDLNISHLKILHFSYC